MYNQNRIYRVFRLINFLRSRPPKSPRALAELVEVTERSVYRYISLITELGFEVKRGRGGKFYIESDLREQIPFSPQETDYLIKMVKSVGKNNKLSHSVLQKIAQYAEHEVAANNIFKANLGKIIERLSCAIQERKQVILVKYFSAHSETVTNRLVEPTQFTDNYEAISAFEVSSMENKYFNVERISDVKILDTAMQHEDKHEYFRPDIFGFQSKALDKEVVFEMSMRVRLLLTEEYPMATPYIKTLQKEGRFLFRAKVEEYEGSARFVMGFWDDVEILGDEGFKHYVQQKVR